jgi:5-methylcytosine-specific restriction protein A
MPKMRMPNETVRLVKDRAQNRCEMCGTADSLRWSFHHRIPRGMGGSRDQRLNLPSNIVLLCGSGTEGCHGHIESHRETAREDGLLLRRIDDPAEVPIKLCHGTVLLDDVGGMQSC